MITNAVINIGFDPERQKYILTINAPDDIILDRENAEGATIADALASLSETLESYES